MKQEVMEKWVAALESGEYKRGKGELKTWQGRFCCLGVLCDIHAKETAGKWNREMGGSWQYRESTVILPDTVQSWAGMKTDSGWTLDKELYKTPTVAYDSLANINDKTRLSFKDIAEIIKKNWEKL